MGESALARASTPPRSPTTLGKFTLLEPIGQGGMACLHLARTAGIGGFVKTVVVKQILPHLAEDSEFIARFIQEARLAATLDHPNIAAVYEVDVQDGVYFFSMEYVRGRDLRHVLRRVKQRDRALGFDEIIAIVSGLCAGLAHAHAKHDAQGEALGIVHRDISPSNVLIGFEGAVKLTDFGVAKARTGLVSTEAGTLRGKIPYMSPEQCRGEALDRRSDIYAVGALLWEMLTGRRLHQADSDVGLIQRIAHVDAPSPIRLRPDCPAGLEAVVMRALHRSPATRYQTATALRDDLEEFARHQGLTVTSSTVARLMAEHFEDTPTPTDASRSALDNAPTPDSDATATVAPPSTSEHTRALPGRTPSHTGAITVSEDGPTRSRHREPPSSDTDLENLATRAAAVSSRRFPLVVGVIALGMVAGLLVWSWPSNNPTTPSPATPASTQPFPQPSTPPASTPAAAPTAEVTAPTKPPPDDASASSPTPPSLDSALPAKPEQSEPDRPRRPNKKSRRRSKKPKQPAPEINLDAAMPPGLDG